MSNDNVKINKRKLNKTEITLIVVACVLFVFILFSFSAKSVAKTITANTEASLSSKTVNNLLYMIMPKEVEGAITFTEPVYAEDGSMSNGVPVVFHVEKNEEFDYETDNGMDFFNVYYVDGDGNRVYTNEDGVFESGAYQSKFEVLFGFTMKTVEKLNKVINVFKIARIVMIFLLVFDLIGLWFVEFSIGEDMKKEQYNKNKPNKKK